MKIKALALLGAALFLGILAVSCKTAENPGSADSALKTPAAQNAEDLSGINPAVKALQKPAASTIATETSGFSPYADSRRNAIGFDLSIGNAEKVRTWKIELLSGNKVYKKYEGNSKNLPRRFFWDGKTDNGLIAPEGVFVAVLTLDYLDTYVPVTNKSHSFILDEKAPTISLKLSQKPYSPIESSDKLTLTIDARSTLSKPDSWSVKIYDPAGNLFRAFDGKWPDNKVLWDGKGFVGDLVESAEDYPVEVTVRDGFGNDATLRSIIPIDILVEKIPTGFRILSSRIYFKAYTDNYTDVSDELALQNQTRLDQVAVVLKKFPGYKIRLVGHAVMVNWDDPEKGNIEQQDVLIPLSRSRADAIKKAMIDRGLDPTKFSTEGVGAADQLVPDSDITNLWKNRRVSFYIEKS